jgi:hypothetical protein
MIGARERRDYRNAMTTSNITRAREYLQAVGAGESYEKVFEFHAADVVIQEFPNRIAPQGRVRRGSCTPPMSRGGRFCNRKHT